MFSVIPLHRNTTEKLEAKIITLQINILSVFRKLINGKLVTHLEKPAFLTDFQNIFRVSRPTDHLFRVVVDKIAWVFNISGATWAVELHIPAEAYVEPC